MQGSFLKGCSLIVIFLSFYMGREIIIRFLYIFGKLGCDCGHWVLYKENAMLLLGSIFPKNRIIGLLVLCFMSVAYSLNCSGTIYFQAPAHWEAVYGVVGSRETKLQKNEEGWYEISAASLSGSGFLGNRATTFLLSNGEDEWVDAQNFGTSTQTTTNLISCDDFNEENRLYIYEGETGKTVLSNEERNFVLHLLIPEISGWMTGIPILSLDAGKTGRRFSANRNLCGWFDIRLNTLSDSVIVYRSNNNQDQIGLNGLQETEIRAELIPLSSLFDSLQTNELYFIPDESKRPDKTSNGWYDFDPGVSGVCEYKIAAYIYDSDQDVNPLFSSSDDGTLNEPRFALASACRGIRHGIVGDTLGPNNKPFLNVGSKNAERCFDNDTTLFNKLFNYRPGVNEVTCYEMTFTRDTAGLWAFNSDEEVFDGYVGGFYPVENKSDLQLLEIDGVAQQKCEECRTLRRADGPVPNRGPANEYVQQGYTDYDKLCNGPEIGGWQGGIDCEGQNMGGNLGRWGDRAWNGIERNEQYCFESHATFVYDSTQEFSFRGDDDIWVYIAGRLAVDNGGAHWSSPGYVVLKDFVDKNGDSLVHGKTYPIDIFFCDRMTTMTNVLIRTNMYIMQQSSIEFTAGDVDTETDFVDYQICFEKVSGSSSNSCGTSLVTSSDTVRYCGSEIKKHGHLDILYTITTRGGAPIDTLDSAKVWYGGIDLSDTNYYHPSINDRIITGLPPGAYRLWIDVEGKKTYMNFRVTGNVNVDIVNKDASIKNTFGPYDSKTKWEFIPEAPAGTRIPVYISKFDGSELDLASAALQTYRIYYDADFSGAIYTSETGTEMVSSKTVLTIDSTGVDTLWVVLPLKAMKESVEKVSLRVNTLIAEIEFTAPILIFATDIERDTSGKIVSWKPVHGDPDSLNGIPYSNWIGSDLIINLLALNGKDSSLCSACSFDLFVPQKSAGLWAEISSMENGEAKLRLNSSQVYEDSTAAITISSSENSSLIFASYDNMKFLKPPVPFPVLVEIYDGRGDVSQKDLEIPFPYHDPAGIYQDGMADSLRIYFDRKLKSDSLPKLICVDWGEELHFNMNAHKELSNYGTLPQKDSLIVCSDTIGLKSIEKSWENRASDSILSFGAREFSKEIKTGGFGDARTFMAFKNYGKKVVQSFDKRLSDKIPPLILKAKYYVDKNNRERNTIEVAFSEPVMASDSTALTNAFAYYMPSATSYDLEERYAVVESERETELFGDSASTLYRHIDGRTIYKTPLVGDYIRFAPKVLSDTLGNFPKDYDSSLPSPWAVITGDLQVRVKIDKREFAEISAESEVLQQKIRDKEVVSVVRFDLGDSIKQVESVDSLSHTIGQWIQVDLPEIYERYKKIDEAIDIEDLNIFYSVSYFTNLGNFVASVSEQIPCDDEAIFGKGETCISNPGNFYIGWNGISNKGRLVGSGVYISSFSWYVQIGNYANRATRMDTFGLRRKK